MNSDVIHLHNNHQNVLSADGGSLLLPPSIQFSKGKNHSDISYRGLALPILELLKSGTVQYILFCVLFLSGVLTFNDHFILLQ